MLRSFIKLEVVLHLLLAVYYAEQSAISRRLFKQIASSVSSFRLILDDGGKSEFDHPRGWAV